MCAGERGPFELRRNEGPPLPPPVDNVGPSLQKVCTKHVAANVSFVSLQFQVAFFAAWRQKAVITVMIAFPGNWITRQMSLKNETIISSGPLRAECMRLGGTANSLGPYT